MAKSPLAALIKLARPQEKPVLKKLAINADIVESIAVGWIYAESVYVQSFSAILYHPRQYPGNHEP